MIPARSYRNLRSTGDPGAELSGESIFSIIWEALADLLGTAATAVIMRRAARRATGACPELLQLEISVRELEYRCAVPSAWTESGSEAPPALRALVGELVPLLRELTGRIAVRRLEQIPELRGLGLLLPETEEKKS
jgi:hypothetical protein